MNLFTRLARDVRAMLTPLDPAAGSGEPIAITADEFLAQQSRMEPEPVGDVLVQPRTHPPRSHRPLVAFSIAAVIALVAWIAALVVSRHSPAAPTDVHRRSSTAKAAKLWAKFPVSATPRPVVLLGDHAPLVDAGFSSGYASTAFTKGLVKLAVPAPASPATRNGYPIISPAAAVVALTAPVNKATLKEPSGGVVLKVTSIELTDHEFLTDRGKKMLPAWQIRLDDMTGSAFVLAVAPSAEFVVGPTYYGPSGQLATVSADGRHITFPYVAHQESAPCSPGYNSSLQIAQTSTAVVLATTTTIDRSPTPSATPSVEFYCDGVAHESTQQPPTPGQVGTRTITLTKPLGARALVNAQGSPYEVAVTRSDGSLTITAPPTPPAPTSPPPPSPLNAWGQRSCTIYQQNAAPRVVVIEPGETLDRDMCNTIATQLSENTGDEWTTMTPATELVTPHAQCVVVKDHFVAVTYQQNAIAGPCGGLLHLGWRESPDRESTLFEDGHP